MLVLSRKPNEEIVLDGNITITVLAITDGRVRIGIDAPLEVSIVREELLVRARNEDQIQDRESGKSTKVRA